MEDANQDINPTISDIKQRVETIVINTLGENMNIIYKKVIEKEISTMIAERVDLENKLKKIKNVVSLFIDKKKADIIFRETSKVLELLS